MAGTKRHWKLLEPLVYQSDLDGTIMVPAGFLTDFSSVPRLPLAYLIAGNRGHRAAVVHDHLYTLGLGDRATADAVLLEALPLDGVSASVAMMMFEAVRQYGVSHWNGAPDPEPTPAPGERTEAP
jgi:hypothetical protein